DVVGGHLALREEFALARTPRRVRLRLGGRGRTRFGHDLISVALRYPDIPGSPPAVGPTGPGKPCCAGAAARREERCRPYPGQPLGRPGGRGGRRVNSTAAWPDWRPWPG